MAVDQAKLEQFVGKAIGDLGAALSAALIAIGDKLGLYKAMAQAGALLPAGWAGLTGTAGRVAGGWLDGQRAGRVRVIGDQQHRWGPACKLHQCFEQALGKAGVEAADCRGRLHAACPDRPVAGGGVVDGIVEFRWRNCRGVNRKGCAHVIGDAQVAVHGGEDRRQRLRVASRSSAGGQCSLEGHGD